VARRGDAVARIRGDRGLAVAGTGERAMMSNAIAIGELGLDQRRGTWSVNLFILTEAMLFVALFFAYFYFGRSAPRWPPDAPPKLLLASIMVVVLLVSSVVVNLSERLAAARKYGAARLALVGTIALGIGFVILQVFEYRDHLRTLQPTTDAYGSIFYTITTFHGAHVVLGLAMLAYASMLPDLEGRSDLPHRPLHNAAIYWHFVDAVWIVVAALLFYLPRLQYGGSAA
jgi:heme/copper-type cytochrome/quinol oxidase subunit 3